MQEIEKIEHRLREINRLKLKLTFGNVPPFYHADSHLLRYGGGHA